MIWRNDWFNLHRNRLNLRIPTHISPFDSLNEGVIDIIYAGCISLEDVVDIWQKWWNENKDKPFHIIYLTKEDSN